MLLQILILLSPVASLGKTVDYISQSFFFDYNKDSEPVPSLVTAQCETVHIEWSRGSSASGPDPVAPYFLQVYTSRFVFPFVVSAGNGPTFDWEVPFAPGTLICMVDKNGNSGGCQDIYTVTSASSTPSCNNATFPLGPLDVEAVQSSGPMSQYAWVDQCSDIGVTPKNGTPPYTLTISPSLHPVYNMTLKDNSQFNWTVSLSWASSFFLSVVDSEGNFWSQGPLHSGGGKGTSTKCLSSDASIANSPALPVGAGIGGLIVGLLVGIGSAVFFMRRKQNRRGKFAPLEMNSTWDTSHVTPYEQRIPNSGYHTRPTSSSNRPLLDRSSTHSNHAMETLGTDYQVEPFHMPGEHGQRDNSGYQPPSSPVHEGQGSTSGSSSGRGGGHVYVVHHDGGRAPVTVYHQDGTQVVELPPQYDQENQASGSHDRTQISGSPSSLSPSRFTDPFENAPGFLQQQRRPEQLRNKTRQQIRLDPPPRS